MNKYLFLFLLLTAGCGVKGVPLPPVAPAPIGRGEPTYVDPKVKTPVKNRYNYKLEEKEVEPSGSTRE